MDGIERDRDEHLADPEAGGALRNRRRKIGALGAMDGPAAQPFGEGHAGKTDAPRRGRLTASSDRAYASGPLDLTEVDDDDDAEDGEVAYYHDGGVSHADAGEGSDGEEDHPEGRDDDENDDAGEGGAEEGEHEEYEYDSWGEWLVDNKPKAFGSLLLVLAIFFGVLYFGWQFASGGGEEEDDDDVVVGEVAAAPREAKAEGGVDRGSPAAGDAGELVVVVPDGGREGPVAVSLSESEVRAEAASWSGEKKVQEPDEGGKEGSASVSLRGDGASSSASCNSVLSEREARSWLCNMKDTSMEGLIFTASQNSDPGQAALEGRMPFLGGSYLVKSEDGSFSASGHYEDVLLDEFTMERTYTDKYLGESGEPKKRTMTVEYKIKGDVGLMPAPVGYEEPPPQEGAPSGAPQAADATTTS